MIQWCSGNGIRKDDQWSSGKSQQLRIITCCCCCCCCCCKFCQLFELDLNLLWLVLQLSFRFWTKSCSSTCVLSEFLLVRAMWLLDLLVLLIVCLLGLLLGSWYLYMKLMMNQSLCHQQGRDPQSMKKSTRNSFTQTEWDQMSLFLTHHGRVLHQEHCQYIGNNRARCRELHLCQICFHRWVVEDFTTPRFLAKSRKVAAWLFLCSLDVTWADNRKSCTSQQLPSYCLEPTEV